MSQAICERTVLRAPAFSVQSVSAGVIALDPAGPNWIATDDRGLRLLARFDGRTPFGDVVKAYAAESGLDFARAWLQAETFAGDALRQGFLSSDGAAPAAYLGRAAYLQTDRLAELWVQVNDFCNLACEHCLVSSGPDRGQGLDTARLVNVIDQAVGLGVERFFFTGGEPLARPDALDLIRHAVDHHERTLVLMTNGTVFGAGRLDVLATLPSERLRVQVSLDGSTPQTNDPIRGKGSFERIRSGIEAAVGAGLRPTVTMTILRHNLGDVEELVRLAASLGVTNVHLLWAHRRGRIVSGPFADLPSATEILAAVRAAARVARDLGVTIDNLEEFRLRFDGRPGVKRDLAGAAWNSLCVYTDGAVYPSASFAGVPELRCGSLLEQDLDSIWKKSPMCQALRGATVEQKSQCRSCQLKFLCGGGDLEHGYWASRAATGRGSFTGHDPYCELYKGLALDVFDELAIGGRASVQARSGFDRPVVLRGMGERVVHADEVVVAPTHSACVLSEEVLAGARAAVRAFYGHAADEPQAALCCPVQPDAEDLAHIPPEVVERFYGCGSPIASATPAAGETVVDLGSGAGIDCFIAAKKVGPAGRVVGVDMTDEMLAVARQCQAKVAGALGYDVVEFRQGFLEEIPFPDGSADVVTSNCVINLSADKPMVFREIWRILKDHGRMVVADIVADREVPPRLRADGQLWGECISGAMSEDALLATLERAGFYGVSILKKTFWREVEGCRFHSVTVRGYKFEKKAGCQYVGQYAIYLGPLKAGIDEEGHLFPRGVPVEVCTDTAAKLQHAPYAGSFAIVDGERRGNYAAADDSCCTPGSGCC